MLIHEQLLATVVLNTYTKLVLFASGMAAFAFVSAWSFKAIARKMSGWKEIAEKFPASELHALGDIYRGQQGDLGIGHYSRAFDIQLAQEGICVRPRFARRIPILIPWPSIRSVSTAKGSILVDVDYEKVFHFDLPAAALAHIRGNVPAERLHEAVSFFEVARAAIKDMEGPRWLWKRNK